LDIIPDSLLVPALLAASEDGLIAWGTDGRVVSWNHAAEHIFGVRARDAIAQPMARFFDAELPSAAAFATGFDAGPSRLAFAAHGIRHDGQRVSLSILSSPIRTHAGALLGAVASVRPTPAAGGAGMRRPTW
jgi:PAS domain S-box-containing protein